MNSKKNNKTNEASESDSDDLENIDRELKDLIDKNESLKKGISKLFNEIEKDNSKTNKSK